MSSSGRGSFPFDHFSIARKKSVKGFCGVVYEKGQTRCAMVCRKYRFLKLLNVFREIKLSASTMPRDIPTRLKNVIWGLSYRKPRE